MGPLYKFWSHKYDPFDPKHLKVLMPPFVVLHLTQFLQEVLCYQYLGNEGKFIFYDCFDHFWDISEYMYTFWIHCSSFLLLRLGPFSLGGQL